MAQSITDLRTGRVLMYEGAPYVILSNSFMRKAQRKPVMRTKLRGVMSGKVLEKTFIAGEEFELIELDKSSAQYLYKDAENAYFMDTKSYEQFSVLLGTIQESLQYLKEGEETVVTQYNGKPISIELPPKVVLKVIETMPGVKGDTATGGNKPATLETGIVVQVPLFINEGESVRINTDTGEYVERANV